MFLKFFSITASFLFFFGAAIGQPFEVHAIGLYEGNVKTGGKVHGPEARVTVDRQDDDVILVLGSMKAVRWFIETSNNTNIAMIYVHGQRAERSEVLLNGTLFSAEVLKINATYRDEGFHFRELVAFLTDKFNVPRIASFQGAYRAPEAPFIVDSVQESAINKKDYLLSQVRPEALTDSLRQFLEEDSKPVARLEDDGFYLLKDGKEIHYPITLDVPYVSWPGLAAYDPINQRLYAGTAWHTGFFYTYDILNDRWSAFEQPRGIEIQGTIYDITHDRLIHGVGDPSGLDSSVSRLIEMSTSGEMAKIEHDTLVGLTDLQEIGNGPAAAVVPLAIDGNLLLARGQTSYPRRAHRTYLINLETGQVTLVGVQN